MTFDFNQCLQILPIKELLIGKEVQMPMNLRTFKQAEKYRERQRPGRVVLNNATNH
jgi:hypothetical protein